MSAPRVREKRLKKPPACDPCKARRVLCHPQPNGAPCPRCVEKETHPSSSLVPFGSVSGSSEFSELTPEFVAHCFECLKYLPQHNHPLLAVVAIKSAVHAVSFQLDRLPPQSRVLALCLVALSSLVSFHEVVLGPGPRPQSFTDWSFFSSTSDVLACGVRRSAAYHALRGQALKAAWEIGVTFQPSNENAAACYLLDCLEQSNFSGAVSRPWASAYISHIRALAPGWRASTYTASDASHWAGFLMAEAIMSTRTRSPILFTHHDQLLLCGPETPSLEAFLASLEAAAQKPGPALLWSSMKPCMFHISCLARQLYETINGDYARLNPLSEAAAIQYLSSLDLLHAIVELLLDRVDASISGTTDVSPFFHDRATTDSMARACAYGLIIGFTSLILPFYRELERRATEAQTPRARERMGLLRAQAHAAAARGAHEFARAIRYLPRVHYAPMHWGTVYAWAEFCAEDIGAEGTAPSDLETVANELKLMGYSLDFSAPRAAALIARLDGCIGTSTSAAPTFFDPAVLDMFLPLEDGWMNDGGMLLT
ncbi:hypothetical protein FB451DRAFT_152126 [Mycena latifolia]|nr:hypothetical protein FB451DRAFT_152126 [Mycena latifolia]